MTSAAGAAVTPGSVSADGGVAIVRLQYPIAEELDVGDLENLEELVIEARADSMLQIEMAATLTEYSSDSPG